MTHDWEAEYIKQVELHNQTLDELRDALALCVEPDWSESKTPPTSVWKSQYAPMSQRLLQADAAVKFRNEHIEHLRMKLVEKQEQSVSVSAEYVGEPVAIDGNTSDGYHTFNELYDFRKAYNVALFNEWAAGGKCSVHKSWRHHDGELCFGGGWFIVVAVLPDGQISNHYEAKDWDLFSLPETERALFEFDGHTGADVINRLKTYTTPQPAHQGEPVAHTAVFNCPNCEYPHRVFTHITGAAQLPWEVTTPYVPEGRQPAPQGEPVAWVCRHKEDMKYGKATLLCTTDKEFADAWLRDYKPGYAWLSPVFD